MMTELFSLRGRTAVVTGALGLLGREHCRCLAEAGANVIVADLAEAACSEMSETLPSKSCGLALDVTSLESVQTLHSEVLKRFGSVDILINNAAANDMFENPLLAAEQSRFENYPIESWRRMMDVNVTGMFICSQVIGSAMARRGTGSIINIASTYGVVAPDQSIYRRPDGEQQFFKSPAYPASKGAVITFTKFLASYWGRAGVRVNVLSPGGVENGQQEFFKENYARKTPMGRMAGRTDYHGAILFLASDASCYMTGANLIVDGGWTII
ncbi:MAG: SDR family oxidoreductase [Dissulfurispiraceae bacterium]|jgi:NAD(P)-dependent dehydrogenase (short-subunit alcohol dehydrogenase family)